MDVASNTGDHIMAKKSRSATLKKKNNGAAASGRPRTIETRVASPTVPNTVEVVQKVSDPLETMFRARQLNERQWHVIERYRASLETLYGQAGGALDFERVRSGWAPGSGLQVRYMDAAEFMRRVRQSLHPLDHTIVVLILGGHGGQPPMTFREAAQRLDIDGVDHRVIGHRFRFALNDLADMVFGETHGADKRGIVKYVADDGWSMPSDATEIKPGRVAHATGRKVFRS